MTTPMNRVRGFRSPVVEVNGALVRPGELLVEAAVEDDLRPLLERHGGRPYAPGPPGRDWRRDPGTPHYGDVNARLREVGLGHRLWVGFTDTDVVDLIRDRRGALHHNHVYVGAVDVLDFYQGGPDGWATVMAGQRPALVLDEDDKPEPAAVAVVDSGVPAEWQTTHPDLVGLFRQGPAGAIPVDPLDGPDGDLLLDVQGGHGLFIAGLVARMAPDVNVQVFRVLHTTGETDDTVLCPVLADLDRLTAPVVNLSLGGTTPDDQPSPLLAAALNAVLDSGKVVVAAAGTSSGAGRPFYPAAYAYAGPPPGVISVGGCDTTGGSAVPWPKSNEADVYAPGVDLVSTHVSGWKHPLDGSKLFTGWARWTGTSFAAPLVAAEIARRFLAQPGPVRAVATGFLDGLPAVAWPSQQGRLYAPTHPPTVWQ
ncbi:S8/S53 family peptidase [Actinosynnema sp. NPDC023658]|uniref:S8/S53 family peptidase n=1 Tax=Actinosynnema sp. NPDC023658 TaxID=3155465 RepID=UPI0033EAC534